jgi:hypothetical protein
LNLRQTPNKPRPQAVSDFQRDRDGAISAVALLGGFAKATAQPLLGAPPELPAGAAAALSQLGLISGADAGSSGGAAAGEEKGDGGDKGASAAAEVVAGEGSTAALAALTAAYAALQKEIEARVVVPEGERAALRRALERAFDSAAGQLSSAHQALLDLERDNARALATRGELSEEAGAEYEEQRKVRFGEAVAVGCGRLVRRQG